MSALSDALGAIKDAIKLADDVRQAGDALKDLGREIREHDRRITRLEAQWDTALALRNRKQLQGRRSERKP